ncbi:MAG: ATP-grasp domain-containing protein, partial [Chloroflexota bacterium]
MFVQEYAAKALLARAGIPVPQGQVARSGAEALAAAEAIGGPVAVKAQVPAGQRGKGGGILFAPNPHHARERAEQLLGSTIAGYLVERVLVEEQVSVDRELYAAVINDASSGSPLVLFSAHGGMDIEEMDATAPEAIIRRSVDIRAGFGRDQCLDLARRSGLDPAVHGAVAQVLDGLYRQYRLLDAELIEVNPLAIDTSGAVRALDCKLSLDDGARPRQVELFEQLQGASTPAGTALEHQGRDLGFLYMELDGDVGVLANGAGLTMATMDVIAHYGGRPANFLEIGGEAYTKARPALELVLSNPRVKSLLINFCGAFARTDVMT